MNYDDAMRLTWRERQRRLDAALSAAQRRGHEPTVEELLEMEVLIESLAARPDAN